MAMELAPRDDVTDLTARPSSGLALSFAEMTMRVAQVDRFYREVMQAGTDYGVIPGTDKPTLYQPGAQMLDQIFGYSPRFEILPSSVIDWQRPIPFFHYVILCRLVSLRTGDTVAEGIGSCNSYEDKYRWRNAKRTCPDCNAEAIIKGKQEYGGGWLCFRKNGGCGAKFRDGTPEIEGQVVGKIENEDSASLENTVSKMAQKRAHIAATLNATGASRIFTQDIEDLPQFQRALRVESVQASPPDEYDGAPDDSDSVHTSDSMTGAPPIRQKCNKQGFTVAWHTAVKRTRFEDDDTRHKFIAYHTQGKYDSLPAFLDDATHEQADALIRAISSRIKHEAQQKSKPAQEGEIVGPTPILDAEQADILDESDPELPF